MSFFSELRRRNVFRVGIAYAVAAWLLLQLTEVLTELLQLPPAVGHTVIVLLAIGAIPVLVFSWVYELTPEGIRRDAEVPRDRSAGDQTARKLNLVTIGMLVAVAALVLFDRFVPGGTAPEPAAATPVTVSSAVQSAVSDTSPGTASPEEAEQAPATVRDAVTATAASVAVLPFVNMSPEQDNEYFSDGISEELLNVLVQINGLRVPSRTSSFAFKNTNQDIREIAEQLEVAHILEGSVRRAGNRVRITAQLIDVSTDTHLWSDTFDRELEDIFAIQDEIANEIAGALQLVLGSQVAQGRPTVNLEAYNLYLQGLYLFQQRGSSLEEAEQLLRRAVDRDPDFADAWATLGLTLIMQPNYLGRPTEEAIPLALEAVDRAEALRPDMAEIFMVRGNAASKAGQFFEAMAFLEQAVALHPEHSLARVWLGVQLLISGYLEEARQHLVLAQQHDPASGLVLDWLGRSRLMLGESDMALNDLVRALQFNRPQAVIGLGVLTREGRLGSARFLDLAEQSSLFFSSRARVSVQVRNGELSVEDARKQAQDYYPGVGDLEVFQLFTDLALYEFTGNVEGLIQVLPKIWYSDSTVVSTLWFPGNGPVRNDPVIKAQLADLGLVDLWRSRGWPDLCRPLGDDDFECDA